MTVEEEMGVPHAPGNKKMRLFRAAFFKVKFN